MLSPVLAGEKRFEEIILNDLDWYAKHGITLCAGDKVEAVDLAARTVTAASGRVEPYDKLLLATGSAPFILPVAGRDLPGVVGFRDLSDVEAMIAAAKTGSHAVVIGSEWPVLNVKRLADRHEEEVEKAELAPWLRDQLAC